jgi:hypothetical protein
VTVGAVSLLAASGCVTRQETHRLGLLMPRGEAPSARVLEQAVEAVHCPAGGYRSGDIGEAVAQAIDSVPGADVLLDVRVLAMPESSLFPGPVQQCIGVVGDAATFD